MSVEFSWDEIDALLNELDARLRAKNVRGSVFIVGGAAMAAAASRDRLTLDIDAITHEKQVLVEAEELAAEKGISPQWLNAAAHAYLPPLPPTAFELPAEPGLRRHYADDRFLLTTKLVAFRSKDYDDIVELARRLDMLGASVDELYELVMERYTEHGQLEMILGPGDEPTDDVYTQIRDRAEAAVGLIRSAPEPVGAQEEFERLGIELAQRVEHADDSAEKLRIQQGVQIPQNVTEREYWDMVYQGYQQIRDLAQRELDTGDLQGAAQTFAEGVQFIRSLRNQGVHNLHAGPTGPSPEEPGSADG